MKNYLVLFCLMTPNRATAEKIAKNIANISSQNAPPFWFDSAYAAIPVVTDQRARKIWDAAIVGLKFDSDLRDLLIIEMGRDWIGRQDAKATHWLASHLGGAL